MAEQGTAGDGQQGQGVLARLLMARDQARAGPAEASVLPRHQPISAARAATTAVARAAERLYGMPISPLDLTPAAITLAEMSELLPRPALLSVVEGPGETLGVVALCPALMTALIEVQTLGRVTSRPVEARRATRSDAMICADFVNALLAELGQEMERIDNFEGLGEFRYASFLDDPRPLLLLLENGAYRSLRFRLRFGENPGREGELFLAMPQRRAMASAPAAASAGDGRAGAGPIGPRDHVAEAESEAQISLRMRDAPIDVVGVLCRRRLRLGLLRNLKPGQILPLPRVDLTETRLETRLGQLLAIGKLGEAGGVHAIRLRGLGEAAGEGPGQLMPPAEMKGSIALGTAPGSQVEPVGAAPIEPPIADLALPDGFRSAANEAAREADATRPVQKNAISG